MKKTTATANNLKTALGPLGKIWAESSVYGLCVDSFDDVYYYDHSGAKTAKVFKTKKELETLIEKLIKFAGKKLHPDMKSIYLNLDDHTRANIVFPPLAISGPSIILTKLPAKKVSLDDLITYKALDEEGKNLILKLIEEGKGILVAGKPGSGKTTLLNTLIEAIPQPQRVLTMERYSDLVIHRPKVCRLQTEFQKAEEMIELVAIAEKMYADYVVLSYFSGPEVMPFLELTRNTVSGMALTTGENPLDALKRLETKAVLSSDGMTLEDARYAISQSLNVIIFQEKRADGQRLVTSVAEIQYASGELKLNNLYKR